jgi:hypothetical protein
VPDKGGYLYLDVDRGFTHARLVLLRPGALARHPADRHEPGPPLVPMGAFGRDRGRGLFVLLADVAVSPEGVLGCGAGGVGHSDLALYEPLPPAADPTSGPRASGSGRCGGVIFSDRTTTGRRWPPSGRKSPCGHAVNQALGLQDIEGFFYGLGADPDLGTVRHRNVSCGPRQVIEVTELDSRRRAKELARKKEEVSRALASWSLTAELAVVRKDWLALHDAAEALNRLAAPVRRAAHETAHRGRSPPPLG